MPKVLADSLAMPKAALLIFAACLGAFLFVLILQFGFDVQPCVLCLWQRAPVGVAGVLALIAWGYGRAGKSAHIFLTLCALSFLVGLGLAGFHTGVERHWWLGTSGCTIQPLHGPAHEDLRTQLLHTMVARCDQISWTLLGLSLANWNVVFSSVMAVFAALAARRACKNRA